MSREEYLAFLSDIEKSLPAWQQTLNRIDPEKFENLSYRTGKNVSEQKSLIQMSLDNVRIFIEKERRAPKVSQSLFIENALASIYDSFGLIGDLMNISEASSSKGWDRSSQEIISVFSQISRLRIRLRNHVYASVEKLESKGCP